MLQHVGMDLCFIKVALAILATVASASSLSIAASSDLGQTEFSFTHNALGGERNEMEAWPAMRQAISESLQANGIDYWGNLDRTVILMNGTADDTLTASFYPEKGTNITAYDFVSVSSNTEVLQSPEDVELTFVTSGNRVNISAILDFNNFPGRVNYTLEARRVADGSLYDSLQVSYIAAGLAIYLEDTHTVVSGAGRSFRIADYRTIYQKPHWTFGSFVQYLNGTDSSEILENADADPQSYFSLTDMRSSFMKYSGQVDWDAAACKISDGIWDGAELTLKDGCGMGFGVGFVNESYYDGFHYGLDFERNRGGLMHTLFEWERFTEGTEFEDELYTNYFLTEIAGTPPSVVRLINPGNAFAKEGGEELYVEMTNSADVNISSFSVNGAAFLLKPGSRHVFSGPEDFYETAVFITEPGTGKRLPWTIQGTRTTGEISADGSAVTKSVVFVDETGFLFSYDDEYIVATGLTPSIFNEAGGENATLAGNFGSFNISNPTHQLLIGNQIVAKKLISELKEGSIMFEVPPRYEVGLSWKFDVLIRIGNSYSVPQLLTFIPSELQVETQVFGASFDEERLAHNVGVCGMSTYMAIVSGYFADELNYNWKILNDANQDLLLLDNATWIDKSTNTLVLPEDFFPIFSVLYKVVAEVWNDSVGGTKITTVTRSEDIVVGVTIISPEARTISTPEVNMRIVAKLDMPDCYNESDRITYEWQYENKPETIKAVERVGGVLSPSVYDINLTPTFDKFVFSYENNTGTFDNAITPTRLGRELVIPREQLAHGIHRISLKVFFTDDIKVAGIARTTVNILKAPLIASIGTGELTRTVSDSYPLYISAHESADPEVMDSMFSRTGLVYHWDCEFALLKTLLDLTLCTEDLMPAAARNESMFIVQTEYLQAKTALALESNDPEVYIKYTLTISKGDRVTKFSQVTTVMRGDGVDVASFERIEIQNALGEAIDPTNIKFWEDVVIRPYAPETTEWRFHLDEPVSESTKFLSSDDKIISQPGYYTPTLQGDSSFQTAPLGIQANKLSPHQTYKFTITFQQPSKLVSEMEIALKTMEMPYLVYPPLAISVGTVDTIFRATATTTYHSNATFVYQFYLLEVKDGSQQEYCVDGCTGVNNVQFRISKGGNFSLQCRLLAANGKTVLDVKNNTKTIEIVTENVAGQLLRFDSEMERDFMRGDDGAVNQNAFFVTECMYEEDEQLVSMAGSDRELCAEYALKWSRMSHAIIRNELPNTANAMNYVRLATKFARLGCVEDETILYELLGMVHQSITRTPPEETLTSTPYNNLPSNMPNLRVEDDLKRFYNLTMTRSMSMVAAGSSRTRVVPSAGVVNNILLDLSEMWITHMTTVATSDKVCGWGATYTSSSDDGIPDMSLAPEGSEPPLGVNTVKVAVICNAEQGSSLETPFASFKWCDSMFKESGSSRKLITLAEVFDYPYYAGIQGLNHTESRRLVMVDITTLGESNQLVSTKSEATVSSQAGNTSSSTIDEDMCYEVGMMMGSKAMARAVDPCTSNVAYNMYPRKVYGEQLSDPFENDAYSRRTIGVATLPAAANNSAVVTARTNHLGLFGATRVSCSHALLGSTDFGGMGGTLGGVVIGILLMVLVVTGLTYALLTTLIAGAAGAEVDTLLIDNYVERDYFGRGQVRLNMGVVESDELSASEESSVKSSLESTGEQLAVLEESGSLEFSDPNLPDHAAFLAAAQQDLPSPPSL